MLQKAYRGEIDYIITKSISRLSRNVLDTLTIIRSLKARSINIYFEKENVNSFEDEKEIDIAFNGVLVQEESRNLSGNIQLGYQRKFEKGDDFASKLPLGYRRENDEWIILPEKHQIKIAIGKEIWATAVIQKILKNEKYKGDSSLQKTYTEEILVLSRSLQLKKLGIKAIQFGKMDKKYFLFPPFALLLFYIAFTSAFGLPKIGVELFENEFVGWMGVFVCAIGILLFIYALISLKKAFVSVWMKITLESL